MTTPAPRRRPATNDAAHDPVVDRVARDLDELAVEATREWWTRYLKGTATFRGVNMAGTRRVAASIQREFGLADLPIDDVIDVARRLLAADPTEDKLCGVLLLAEHHLERLETRHTGRLAEPLAAGDLADWNSCDWYAVKLLAPFVRAADVERRARTIAGWRDADGLWQRRAAAVAFVPLAPGPEPFAGFDDLLLEVAAANVTDPTRWSQTSVGWLLRELSHRNPEAVVGFVGAHDELSTEARRNALSAVGAD